MAGTINSLGIGSGVLTADVIDKLKANDEANILTPVTNKITLNQQKGQALDLLSSLLNSFKSSASALDDDTLYQKRTVSGGNDYVSVSAAAGTEIKDFSLAVGNIAKKTVLQSSSYTATTSLIANGTGTLNLAIGGTNFSIDYASTTTLDGLKQAINDIAGTKATASILQTGTSAFSLIITSKATGQAQSISLSDITGQLKDTKLVTPNTKTGTFLAKDDFIAGTGTSGNLSVNVGATTVNFAYTDTTTLSSLVDSINADTTINTKVTANIVQYGTNDFRMVLTPKSDSVGSAINITDSVGGGLVGAITGTTSTAGTMGIIQDPQDAHFTLDGISITRTTNTITDLASGLTVNLLKDSGSANISITQNRDQIATEMGSMVSSYNTLIKQLGDMTGYDAKEGKVGIFNGDNTIKNISREITRIITSFSNSSYSLPQYGISLDKAGVMSLDKAVFTAKFNSDPDGTEGFFNGKSTISSTGVETYTKGVFTSLNDLLKGYTSSSGLMSNLTLASKAETTSLNEERTKQSKLLEARYATLQAKFAAYDSIISKLNSQFSSLKQQIDAQANANR